MRSALRPKALVANWFDFLPALHRPVAQALREAIRAAEPGVVEGVKWGNLVFDVDGQHLLAIVPHKAHLNLQIFNGSELPAELGPLDGVGRGSRNLRCRLHQPLDGVLVQRLVVASVALLRAHGGVRPPRTDRP